MTPVFSATKAVPSGAKATATGSLRLPIAIVSWKPAGTSGGAAAGGAAAEMADVAETTATGQASATAVATAASARVRVLTDPPIGRVA